MACTRLFLRLHSLDSWQWKGERGGEREKTAGKDKCVTRLITNFFCLIDVCLLLEEEEQFAIELIVSVC